MGANKLLILRAKNLNERLEGLLVQLRDEPHMQQLYVKDPVGLLQKHVFPEHEGILSAEINRGNRLLYALLSNNEFMSWAQSYEEKLVKEAVEATQLEDQAAALNSYLAIVDRSKIHSDLAVAVADTGSAELIAALTWKPDPVRIGGQVLPQADVAVDIETFVYAVAAVAVFAVAVAAVFVGAVPERDMKVLTRADILEVANHLNAELERRALDVRASGKLTDFSQRNIGFTR